ncbi:hypothetical Protein YC6258_04608 [Gynuella sunshinyii YC6258]|uniref:Uncharacterized protein n=1 Tax=Gynuella sunshinyii YC6258 TaxID=1445510 RepID=A0A0C5VBB3_9GAMM|nr:hypothetical Protein YC6258_04608 [Gynuella sunshinyii YC6258]
MARKASYLSGFYVLQKNIMKCFSSVFGCFWRETGVLGEIQFVEVGV